MSQIEKCIGCQTVLRNAPGIGPICPNAECDRNDDQRPDSERVPWTISSGAPIEAGPAPDRTTRMLALLRETAETLSGNIVKEDAKGRGYEIGAEMAVLVPWGDLHLVFTYIRRLGIAIDAEGAPAGHQEANPGDKVGDRSDLVLDRDQLRARVAELEGASASAPQIKTLADVAGELAGVSFRLVAGSDGKNEAVYLDKIRAMLAAIPTKPQAPTRIGPRCAECGEWCESCRNGKDRIEPAPAPSIAPQLTAREDLHDALKKLIPDLAERNAAIYRIMAPAPAPTPKALELLVAHLEGEITSGRVTEIELTSELMDLIAEARRSLVLPSAPAPQPTDEAGTK